MNVYDSSSIIHLMKSHNYEECDDVKEADLIIFNTCHIREKAAERVYSVLRNMKKIKKKDAIIVLAGCVAQAEGDAVFMRVPFVDFIVGPQNIHKIPEMIAQKTNNKELDFPVISKFDHLVHDYSAQVPSAFLAIQEGCDKFCSFCVVPYTRGPEYSRPVCDIYKEALLLVNQGVKEIILLGQNVNAYHGLKDNGDICSLGELIAILSKIKEIERLRYITSHPADMHDELYDAHKHEEKLMPFIHLPVQSGSDYILKRMNRKYTVNEYIDIVDRLIAINPNIKLSSDIIVGFPGETDADFEKTIDLISNIDYIQCFSFSYSPRIGTPGADFVDQIPEKAKQERLHILQKIINDKQYKFNAKLINTKVSVLCTGYHNKHKECFVGRTPYMQLVRFTNSSNKNPESIINKIVDVGVCQAFQNSVDGVLLT